MSEWVHPHRPELDAAVLRAREIITDMARTVESAILRSVEALVERDVGLCNQIIDGDQRVNDLHYELRDLCFRILLTQTPVARDLREVLGFHHMGSELERMADHCVNVARSARDLAELPRLELAGTLTEMANACARQVHEMLEALIARDVKAARRIARRDEIVNRIYRSVFDELIGATISDSSTAYRTTKLIFVAHDLERVADRVTNLAEDLVYLETGEVEELGGGAGARG